MPDDLPDPPDPPKRTCPACGTENFAFAARCLKCTALLDRPAKVEIPPVRMHFDDGLESEPRYNKEPTWRPTWNTRPESLLQVVFRVAGVVGLVTLSYGFFASSNPIYGVLLLLLGVAYVALSYMALVRRQERAPTDSEELGVTGCLDFMVRGFGCIIIGVVSIVTLMFAICMALYWR